MGTFLEQAGQILDTAFQGEGDQDIVIVIDRQGGMRLLDPAGWTLPAVAAEFGAESVYRVDRRGGSVRVEGLCGSERCLLQRKDTRGDSWRLALPGMTHQPGQAMMLHTGALAVG